MSRSEAQRLEDFRAAISRCIAYREHLDSAEFGAMAYDAVLRNLAVVGEAVKSLPEGFRQEHANTPWASIAGLRNVVVHEYFRVTDGWCVKGVSAEPFLPADPSVPRERADIRDALDGNGWRAVKP